MNRSLHSLVASIFGLSLLMPASYFLLTLVLRIFLGSRTLYYAIAPDILQANFSCSSMQLSVAIVYGPLIAVLLNMIYSVRMKVDKKYKWELSFLYEGNWLNTAVALQSILLFLIMVVYLVIEHYRY